MERAEQIIKAAREKKGLTQTEMGAKLGIGLRMYQKIEDGEFPKYKKEQIKKLDEELGTKVYELIYEINNDNSTSYTVNEPGESYSFGKKGKPNRIDAKNVDAGKQIGLLMQENIKITASLSVLEQMMDKVVSDQTGKSIALVSGERQQATDMMALRLFEQWKKKLE